MNEEELENRAERVGQMVFELLNLEMGASGLIATDWGNKTIEGLGLCIMGIVEITK